MKTIILDFKNWLKSKKYNPNTIRNYLADIRKYISFSIHSDDLFSQQNLQSYLLFVKDKKNSRRYLTSLSKFFQFALSENLIESNPFKNTRKQLLNHRNTHFDKFLQMYQTNLNRLHKTPITIKNYINDIQQLFDFYYSQSISLDEIFTSQSMEQYIIFLKNTHRSLSSIKRKLSSLTSFQNFLLRRKFLSSSVETHHDASLHTTPTPLYPQKNKFRFTNFLSRFYRNDITKPAK